MWGVGILNEVLVLSRRALADPSYGGVGLKVRKPIHHTVSCCLGVPNLSVCETSETYIRMEEEFIGGGWRQSNLFVLQQYKYSIICHASKAC